MLYVENVYETEVNVEENQGQTSDRRTTTRLLARIPLYTKFGFRVTFVTVASALSVTSRSSSKIRLINYSSVASICLCLFHEHAECSIAPATTKERGMCLFHAHAECRIASAVTKER